MFGCNGNFYFPEIHFQLTKIYSFDPELILHSYFRFKSFPEKERVREREREERAQIGERERGRRESRRDRPTSDRPTSEKKQNGDRQAARSSDERAHRTIAPLVNRDCERARRSASALVDRRAARSSDERDRPTNALVDRAASRTIAPISPPISSRAARSHLLLRCTDLLLRSRLHRFDEFVCWVLLFL